MKLLFEWLFVALLEVAQEGLPAQKKKRKLRAFPFFLRAATGNACRCFHFCLRTCPSGWGDGLVRLRRNRPRIYVEEAAIPWEHQPAAAAPDERRNDLPKAEHGTQEHSPAL